MDQPLASPATGRGGCPGSWAAAARGAGSGGSVLVRRRRGWA